MKLPSISFTKWFSILMGSVTAVGLCMMEQYGYAVLIIIVWWVQYHSIKDVD